MSGLDRITDTFGLLAPMRRAGLIPPRRPDKYLKIAAMMLRENMAATSGFASAAQRCPDRAGLIDELGTLTWKQIDECSDALGAGLQALPRGQPKVIGIMCRNHRGFVEALVAANRIGSDVLLLTTSFAGPALAEVVACESADAVIYDEEFTDTVERALADRPDATRIVAWTDNPSNYDLTVQKLIDTHTGKQPNRAAEKSRTVLLTSGTTGTPKGAKLTGGDAFALKAILDRTPRRAEETVVIVAQMFHALGFSQLNFPASMPSPLVPRGEFAPAALVGQVHRPRAT